MCAAARLPVDNGLASRMRQEESTQSLASRILRGALRVAALPFYLPAEVLRRTRGAAGERAQAAEQAKFNTRKWTPELLKHLEWRRFEETCAAWLEALGYATRITPSRAGGGVDIALCVEGSQAPSILAHCKPWDAYRVGIKG